MGHFTIPLPTTTQFSEHSRKKLYSLSKRFSPPKIDLLSADYLDSGSTQPSTRFNNPHKTVEDVKTEELQIFREFSFMTPGDLIFYLSPILDAHTKDTSLEATDFFIYSFERKLEDALKLLSDEEKETLIQALTYLYEYNWQAAVTTSESSLDSILHVEIQPMIDFHSCPDILRLINRNSHSERVF